MSEPRWLEIGLVLDFHAELLALFGGPDGVRDIGLLESELARPVNRFAYGETDLSNLAAAYGFGIAKNHPFVDGNKRTALASMIVFLGLNGMTLRPPRGGGGHCFQPRGGRDRRAAWIAARIAPLVCSRDCPLTRLS